MFKEHVSFNMAMDLWTVCRVFFTMAGKGAASFLGSIMEKMEPAQNWGNAAKESILLAAGRVLIEAADRGKHG